MSANLTNEEFSKNLHTKFHIRLSETEAIEAELTKISEHLVSDRQERFAIVFRGPANAFLAQGMRRFEHDQMGELDLFIVPISQDDKGVYYEAVFNRLPQTD